MTSDRPTTEALDREMAFSMQHHNNYSCGDLHPTMRECRRMKGHNAEHAAGYGEGRVFW